MNYELFISKVDDMTESIKHSSTSFYNLIQKLRLGLHMRHMNNSHVLAVPCVTALMLLTVIGL